MQLNDNPLVDGSNVDAFIIMNEGWTSLEYLRKEVGSDNVEKMQSVHYYPPNQQGSVKRSTPKLHHRISEFGGIREDFFQRRKICLLVDDAVFNGRTLRNVVGYVCGLGYNLEEIFVYARDIRHTDPEWDEGALCRDPCLQHISAYRELIPDLIPEELRI